MTSSPAFRVYCPVCGRLLEEWPSYFMDVLGYVVCPRCKIRCDMTTGSTVA
jgi:hypothetical protein